MEKKGEGNEINEMDREMKEAVNIKKIDSLIDRESEDERKTAIKERE